MPSIFCIYCGVKLSKLCRYSFSGESHQFLICSNSNLGALRAVIFSGIDKGKGTVRVEIKTLSQFNDESF